MPSLFSISFIASLLVKTPLVLSIYSFIRVLTWLDCSNLNDLRQSSRFVFIPLGLNSLIIFLIVELLNLKSEHRSSMYCWCTFINLLMYNFSVKMSFWYFLWVNKVRLGSGYIPFVHTSRSSSESIFKVSSQAHH